MKTDSKEEMDLLLRWQKKEITTEEFLREKDVLRTEKEYQKVLKDWKNKS